MGREKKGKGGERGEGKRIPFKMSAYGPESF